MAAVELWNTSLWNDANLVAYYRAENSNDNKPSPSFNLTNNNSVSFNPAKFNNGFDTGSGNTNKSLSIASNLGITGGPITINTWFNSYDATYPAGSDRRAIVSCFDNSTQVDYRLYIYTTGLAAARLKSGVAWQETAQVAISASTMYMATLTYDGTNIALYLNGTQQGSSVAASGNGTGSAPSGTSIFVGAVSPIGYVSAIADDISFFSRALSSTEISNLYNGTLGPAIHSIPNKVILLNQAINRASRW